MRHFEKKAGLTYYTGYLTAKIGPKSDQNRPKIDQKSVKNRFWPIFHDPDIEPSFLSTHMHTFEKTGFSRRTGIRIGKIMPFLTFGPLRCNNWSFFPWYGKNKPFFHGMEKMAKIGWTVFCVFDGRTPTYWEMSAPNWKNSFLLCIFLIYFLFVNKRSSLKVVKLSFYQLTLVAPPSVSFVHN